MACYEFEGIKPVIHPSSFVHPDAVIIGDVWIGEHCYIGPLASLRGDFGRIIVEKGSNVQDCCILHGFPDHEVLLEENSHIGHGAIIHTATIRRDALVGMSAVVLDYAEVGERSIVAANSTVSTNTIIPPESLFAGSPGTVKRTLTAENIRAKHSATKIYHELARRCQSGLKSTEPLRNASRSRDKLKWELEFDATFKAIKKDD